MVNKYRSIYWGDRYCCWMRGVDTPNRHIAFALLHEYKSLIRLC
jgi:hypothetical protein